MKDIDLIIMSEVELAQLHNEIDLELKWRQFKRSYHG